MPSLVVLGWVATQIAAPGSTADPAIAERTARAYAGAGEYTVAANRVDRGLRTVGLQQMWHGVPVVDGEIGFVFGGDKLFAVSDHRQAVTAKVGAGHAIYRDRLVDIEDRDAWTLYVDPATRAIVGRKRRWPDATGTLAYDVGTRYATGPRSNHPADTAFVTVNGTAATTGSDGSFSWSGTSPASVQPGLIGTYVQIVNGAGALATATLGAPAGGTTVWSLASDEVGDAQVSAFVYVNMAKERARVINPAIASDLDQQLPVYVNTAGSCNAFTTMTDLHFYRADAECQNTARLADVVLHEFGHWLHMHSIIAGMGAFDQELSEGLADFNAANITEDPNVGRGFYYDDNPVRQIDPYGFDPRWPDEINYDPHVTGEIVSGALWDLRTTFVQELGHDPGVAEAEAIFAGVLQRAHDIPSSFTAALVADDDNNNLADGTPHYCEIQRAFGRHGLADASYQPTIVQPPVVDGLALSVGVQTPAAGVCPVAHVTSIEVAWQPGQAVGGTFRLMQTGDTWTGTFPDQPPETVITYSLDVTFDDGSHLALPQNPADPTYQLFVGLPREIWCEHFETDPHWDQTGGGFEWGRVLAIPSSHDPTACHGGEFCIGTKLASTGVYANNENTTLSSPVIDVSSYEHVHLQYWRWLSVEDALYDQATVLANGTQIWENAKSKPGTLEHVDKEWTLRDFDVTPNVGEDATMQITWSLVTDSSGQYGGWTIDDVCLVGIDKLSVCGDHILDDGEQCDDGNTNNGDGCSATCRNEIVAGGGGCHTAGEPTLLVALYFFASRSRRRAARSSSGRLSART